MTFESPGAKHRPGGLLFKYLSLGIENTPENYMFVLAHQKDFYSPRHRHNFDQFRYAVSGEFNLAPDIVLKEGELAYHPEGVFYGPQNDGPEERVLLVLQFGGASGAGFMSLNQIRAANNELVKVGKFEKGKYYANDTNGRETEPIDGYEAAWTHITKKKLEYPPGRYERPVVMSPANFHWKKVGEDVYKKLLGVFSEKEVVVQMWKIDRNASLDIGGDDAIHLAYILEGEGEVGNEMLIKESVVRLRAGQTCTISSTKPLQMLHFVMPTATAQLCI